MTDAHLQDRIARADVLVEALPSIRRLSGRIVVVKLGGAAIDSGDTDATLEDVVLLHAVGVLPVLVHGGGPEISAWQKRLGIEARFVDGLRVTDAPTMEIARMVLTGKVSPDLVGRIHRLGGDAIGISGEDGRLLMVRRRDNGDGADLGFVGDVTAVDPAPLHAILAQGAIPVVASIGAGDDGLTYNVNADHAAAALAVALKAARLVLLTDVEGVRNAEGVLEPTLEDAQARQLIASGVINGGMVPKVEAALRGLNACEASHILDGRMRHALLLELLTDSGVGTMLRPVAAAGGVA